MQKNNVFIFSKIANFFTRKSPCKIPVLAPVIKQVKS